MIDDDDIDIAEDLIDSAIDSAEDVAYGESKERKTRGDRKKIKRMIAIVVLGILIIYFLLK